MFIKKDFFDAKEDFFENVCKNSEGSKKIQKALSEVSEKEDILQPSHETIRSLRPVLMDTKSRQHRSTQDNLP